MVQSTESDFDMIGAIYGKRVSALRMLHLCMIIYWICIQGTNIRNVIFKTVMSLGPRPGGMAEDVFWLKGEYKVYIQ